MEWVKTEECDMVKLQKKGNRLDKKKKNMK